jgi:hypothetical protein
MFGFIKEALKSSARQGLLEDFQKARDAIQAAPRDVQIGVAVGLNTATTMFVKRFGGVSGFSELGKSDRLAYLRQLADFEERILSTDQLTGLGVAVFKMWLGAVIEDDQELRRVMEPFLKELGLIGDGIAGSMPKSQQPRVSTSEVIVIACPVCTQKLRIPDRHGIEISCPKCRYKFTR